MTKDVVYIEAEDDITDIIAKVKDSKSNIVALVPPKKAGVLRSAVNFKLIAKTAIRSEKTVVLISNDASLVRLAAGVKMPVAKTLQSKPQLPDLDTAEFGDEPAPVDDAVLEDDAPAESEDEAKKPSTKKTAKASVKSKKTDDTDEEDDEDEEPVTKRKKPTKIPNFQKYRKFIIAGGVAFIALVAFIVWAVVFAPAVKISVNVKTTANNFAERVTFVSDENVDDPENGIFYIESKTVNRSAKADFAATGEVDKGEKATGTVQVIRPKGTVITSANSDLIIPVGTVFTYDGKAYVSTTAGSANAAGHIEGDTAALSFKLKEDVYSQKISVVAKENGEAYNVGAASGWTAAISGCNNSCKIEGSAMTGGTSRVVKIVSQNDVSDAEANLDLNADGDPKDELSDEFGDEYILIGSSFSSTEGKVSTSPAVNEEVGEGVTPQITKEVTYTISAVRRDDIEKYIRKVSEDNLGDDTQMVHDTGIKNAFIDSYKESNNGSYTGKLKSVVRIGPKVTEEIVAEKSLGKKVGEVQAMIKSINGVSKVEVKRSFFWVSSIPKDINKVNIEIVIDEE